MPSLDYEMEKEAFLKYYDDNIGKFQTIESQLKSLIQSLVSQLPNVNVHSITGRVKDRDECIKKFNRKYRDDFEKKQEPYEIKDCLNDLVGLRVVCLYEDELDSVRELLDREFEVVDKADKVAEVEQSDKEFGYKALHLDLKIKSHREELPEYEPCKDFLFEVQIRTINQDAWSVLEHKIGYKKSIPHLLKRQIHSLAAVFEIADHLFLQIREEIVRLQTPPVPQSGAAGAAAAVPPPLDALSCMPKLRAAFPEYPFIPESVDSFITEMLALFPGITVQEFQQALTQHLGRVQEYRDYQRKVHYNKLNPYTQVRHVLYLSDKAKYQLVLYANQRENFDEWLTQTT